MTYASYWNHTSLFSPQNGVPSMNLGPALRTWKWERKLERYDKQFQPLRETVKLSQGVTQSNLRFAGLGVEMIAEITPQSVPNGGDFCDSFSLGRDKIALVVGDVSVKDACGAQCISEIRDAVRTFLTEYRSPSLALAQVNNYLCRKQLWNDQELVRPITMALAVLDCRTGELQCCAAGAEPFLILRAHGSRETVNINGLAMGILDGEVYGERTVHLGQNDKVVMVTDGITQSRQGPWFLGYDGMTEIAAQTIRTSPSKLGQTVLEQARAFAGAGFSDDASVLVATRTDLCTHYGNA